MKLEEMGRVSPTRMLARIFREDPERGIIARPTGEEWSPIAQIIQVGADVPLDYKVGQWIYVSPYAGTRMSSMEREDGLPATEGRLVITTIDVLAFLEDTEDVRAICADRVA